MIPVYQTIDNIVNGNCIAACLASIFEDSIDNYPDFTGIPTSDTSWLYVINECLIKEKDYYLMIFNHNKHSHLLIKGYHLIMVDVVGFDHGHCLVGKDTKIVFNPSKINGKYENIQYGVIVKCFNQQI